MLHRPGQGWPQALIDLDRYWLVDELGLAPFAVWADDEGSRKVVGYLGAVIETDEMKAQIDVGRDPA